MCVCVCVCLSIPDLGPEAVAIVDENTSSEPSQEESTAPLQKKPTPTRLTPESSSPGPELVEVAIETPVGEAEMPSLSGQSSQCRNYMYVHAYLYLYLYMYM